MKVTYNWLKEFVDIKISPQALADKLTMAGLEVTALNNCDGDTVFEIEITSNRPDWLSVIGIAREIAAGTNKKLKSDSRYPIRDICKKLNRSARVENRTLEIKIEDKKDCPVYTVKIIKNVKVGPSPAWLKNRLESIGCRSVNNVVDITNYILFTYGEPLHVFDLDKLSIRPESMLNIIVRKAIKDEKIITLDGQERILDETNLVIASDMDGLTVFPLGRPIAIAGIMGGKATEVTEETSNILLEAAVFNPIIIRRSRQKLGIQTDSSYRFERSVAVETAVYASGQAVNLIAGEAGGKCVLAKSTSLPKTKNRLLDLNAAGVNRLIGVEIKTEQIKKILTALGFTVQGKNNLKAGIPAYRQDIKSEIDLIEEIARIYGYENIPKSLPEFIPQINPPNTKDFISTMKNILIGLGLNEVITYSLVDKDMLRGFDSNYSNPLEILNPLSKDQEILRPTLIPCLLRRVAYNLNQKQEPVNIFEIAKIFLNSKSGTPEEEFVLAVALCGTGSKLLEQSVLKEVWGILHLKGIIETLFQRLGIEKYSFEPTNIPNETAVYLDGNNVGRMFLLQEKALGKFDIKNKNVVVGEIKLTGMLPYLKIKKKFKGVPLYPGIYRDISMIINQGVKVQDLLITIKEQSGLLREVKVVDYYKGKQIPSDCKGLTISCLYRSDERTLTDTEITPIHSSICDLLIKKFASKIR